MKFEPDIIVANRESGPSLVVEAKLTLEDPAAAERQIARYMFGMRCPSGMLITPERVWLYRDTYRDRSESAIERILEFDAPASLAQQMPHPKADATERAALFEEAVQAWMERLAQGSGLDELSPDARSLLEDYVVPVLRLGEIRAGHPRWRRTGS